MLKSGGVSRIALKCWLAALVAGEDSVAFVAGENGAPRAYHAGRVQILRMVLDVEQNYLLGDPVEDVLGALAAAHAKAFFTAQLLGQTAQARYPVGTKDA
jgi:hypothetical protein